jgi:hypothetical protein
VGVILAAASFVRVHALLFPFIFAVALIWRHRTPLRELIPFVAISFVAMAACIAPWTIRNTHVFGEVVPISDNSGAVFWAGNNDLSTGECCAPLPADVQNLPEIEIDHVLRERTKTWVRENPGQAAWLFWRKLYLTHNRETMGIVWNEQSLSRYLPPAGIMAAKLVSSLYWLGVFVFGVAGAILVLQRERWRGIIHPAIVLWAYFAFVHAVAQASDRYHLPSTPFIALLAGLALADAWQWYARRSATPALAFPAEQES